MKNKVYIICVILIILIVLFIIGTKYGEKIGNNMDKANINEVETEERLYQSPDNFVEEYTKVKGKYDNNIKGKDYFYISNTVFLNEVGIELDGYSEFIVNITPESKILDYNSLENIDFNDIQQNDVIFYNGIVKKAKDSASAIEVGGNEIYVLKNSDIQKLAMEKYSGSSTIDNVRISYVDEDHIMAQITVDTYKNDVVIYLAYLKLSNDVKVDEYCRNKYANIVMSEPFNDFSEGENEVIQIDYK